MQMFNDLQDADLLNFDKFDREITYLLDQMQQQQPDFYTHHEASRKSSLHDFDMHKPQAS